MDLQEDNTHLSRVMDNLSSTLPNRYVLLYWTCGDRGQRRIEAVVCWVIRGWKCCRAIVGASILCLGHLENTEIGSLAFLNNSGYLRKESAQELYDLEHQCDMLYQAWWFDKRQRIDHPIVTPALSFHSVPQF